jgi:N-ethylmaleimide reductase
MAPLTRSRSEQPGGIPGDLMVQYYSDRASDGGLIVSEATNISLTARGWYGAPGLYTDQQVEGWKRVVRAIHAKNGLAFAQLWHTGRSSHSDNQDGNTPVSASVDASYWEDPNHLVSAPSGWVQPSPHRALDIAEIPGIVEDYRKAARAPRQLVSTGLNCTPAMAIYWTSFSKMAVTSGPTPTVVPSRTARVSCWKS